MIDVKAKVTQKPDFGRIQKNFNFGVATGLTKTAKESQKAVQDSLRQTFTLRGSWFEQSNKFGIKIRAATKTKLQAEIKTLAEWLELHEEGGIKTPKGKMLAIPTENVRRTKRQIIQKSQRPAALRGKNTYVVDTKSGPVLFQRKGKGKRARIVALYRLEPTARIKKQSTFFQPIRQTITRNLMANVREGIRNAYATAGKPATEAKGVWAFD